MSVNINADTTNGLVLTSDTSGEIKLQSAGADIATVDSSGITMAAGKTLPASALTGSLPAIDGSAITGLALGKVNKITIPYHSNATSSGGTLRTLSGTDLTFTENSIIKGQFTKDSSSTLLIVQGHISFTNTAGNAHGCYTWVGTNTTGGNTQRYHHALDPQRQHGNKGNYTFTAIFSGLAAGTYYASHGCGRGDTGSSTNVVNYNPQSYVGADTPNENSRSHISVWEVEV